MNHHYKTLGLKTNSSRGEIKSAYRRLAKKFHPDVSREPDAEKRFIEITEAYEWLTDERKRRSYSSQSSPGYSKAEAARRKEQERKEKARNFARMNFEAFKKNNDAFKRSWYYNPVKYFTYTAIVFGFILASAMFLSPLLAWFITENILGTMFMIPVFIFSFHTFRYTIDLKKGVKPYFAHYD